MSLIVVKGTHSSRLCAPFAFSCNYQSFFFFLCGCFRNWAHFPSYNSQLEIINLVTSFLTFHFTPCCFPREMGWGQGSQKTAVLRSVITFTWCQQLHSNISWEILHQHVHWQRCQRLVSPDLLPHNVPFVFRSQDRTFRSMLLSGSVCFSKG